MVQRKFEIKMKKLNNPLLILLIFIFFSFSACSKKEIEPVYAFDMQKMKVLVFREERTRLVNTYDADFVIVGGSIGGLAAALAACSSGRTTILIEETDSFAACFASPDTIEYSDSRFLDIAGSSLRNREFRQKIREWYEANKKQQPEIVSTLFSYPGYSGGDNFCFESDAALDVIMEMLEKHITRERLTILTRHKVVKAVDFNQRIASLNLVDLNNKLINQVTGWLFIDATDTGELLPLAGIEYSLGKESRAETDEAHAADAPDSLGAFDNFYFRDVPAEDASDFYETDLYRGIPESPKDFVNVRVASKPRHLIAMKRIFEQDISAEYTSGPRASFFKDSIGIGYSPIRLQYRPHWFWLFL